MFTVGEIDDDWEDYQQDPAAIHLTPHHSGLFVSLATNEQ